MKVPADEIKRKVDWAIDIWDLKNIENANPKIFLVANANV